MSEITLKIDKGNSSSFSEIMELLQGFPGLKECRKHYSVKLKEDDIFRFRNELERIVSLLPELAEKEWFNIPAYGTDEWANCCLLYTSPSPRDTERSRMPSSA